MGSLSFLQGIFVTQESNRSLLHCRWILYQLSYQGSPTFHVFPKPYWHCGTLDWSSLSRVLSLMGACVHARLLQLCPTLWDHMDCRPPGSSVHGILQARQLLTALLKKNNNNNNNSKRKRGANEILTLCKVSENLEVLHLRNLRVVT